MSRAYAAVLERLADLTGTPARGADRQRVSRCPAHDDRAPSLSVSLGDDGRVLLHCHAGCAVEDVLATLGLATRDLFDEPTRRADVEPVREYSYCDEAGELLFVVERRPGKQFRQRRPDGAGGWAWKLNGARRVLYRLPEVLAAASQGRRVYVVEGEKDVEAAERVGVVATCNPGGAGKWRPQYASALAGADVVVVADRDEPGRRHAAQVAASLRGVASAVVVVEAADGKDLADHLAAGRTLGELVEVEPAQDAPGHPASGSAALDGEEADGSSGGTGRPGGGRPESAATALVALAEQRYRFGVTADGECFAVPQQGPQVVRVLRGGSGSLRAELSNAYYRATGRAAPQQALADALLVLEGGARDSDPEELHLRVAAHGDELWLDLGDTTGRAARVDPTGWTVEERAPVLFRRTALTGALPTPERGGRVEELWDALNVAPEHRPLLLAVLVASLLPDLPHPVVALLGEQGTGKSTATRALAALVDASPAQLRKPPRDAESWVTAAAGSWVVALDNLSSIPEWLSDSLCRASTGDGDVRRRLYSDGDLAVFAFRRVVLLNGIDLGALRDDLAERLVAVQLERIPDGARRYDADLARAWAERHPRLLGALLDLTAQVLAALPDVDLPDPPRMADFARVLAAVDDVLGTDGLATYRALAGDLAADALAADPVLAAIVARVDREWIGTAAELLELLEDDEHHPSGKDWPKSARAMTSVLRRRGPSLRRVGWRVDDLGRGGHGKQVRFALTPPDAGDDAGDVRATRATSGRRAGDERARRPQHEPPLTSEDARGGADAGVAGDEPLPPLCPSREKEGEGGSRDHPSARWAHPTPATPAMPATGTAPPRCEVCKGPLDLTLADVGETVHATCEEP